MAGPTTAPRIILLAAATTTATGPAIGVQGDTRALAGASTTGNQMEVPIEVWVTNLAASSTATVVIETSQDNSSYTVWGTFVFTSQTGVIGSHAVGALKKTWIRARITAISGATITAYMKVG